MEAARQFLTLVLVKVSFVVKKLKEKDVCYIKIF